MDPVFSFRKVVYRRGSVFSLSVDQLDIDRNKIHIICGTNGAGKSTFLNILALLLKPQQGSFVFSGQQLDNNSRAQPSLYRKVTLVEQSPYLLRGNVIGNLTFGLKIRGVHSADQHQRISEALTLVGLSGFASRQIKELSGGELQRVALARAVVLRPEVLLLDEPTAKIDHDSLPGFERLLQKLVKEGMTVIMSTHDQAQADRLYGQQIKIQNGTVLRVLADPVDGR